MKKCKERNNKIKKEKTEKKKNGRKIKEEKVEANEKKKWRNTGKKGEREKGG